MRNDILLSTGIIQADEIAASLIEDEAGELMALTDETVALLRRGRVLHESAQGGLLLGEGYDDQP